MGKRVKDGSNNNAKTEIDMASKQAVDVREKTSKVLDRMSKIEALGEEVLTDKQQVYGLIFGSKLN